MRKVLRAGLIAILLFAIASSLPAKPEGTAFFPLMQADSPLALLETTHTLDDGLESAILQNRGSQAIVEYRMGWVAVFPQGTKTGLGIRVLLPEGAMPGRTVRVPAQQVSMDLYKEGAIGVGFFVSEVRFADGRTWKADLDSTELAVSKQCSDLSKIAK
jgi:hypothetical protein